MREAIRLGLLLLVIVAPALAEEFALKDGTKIVGRMLAVKGDKIEVETAYGKMEIRRADILAINFPENAGPGPSSTGTERKTPTKVDEALEGTEYVNRTAGFTLTVPIEWKTRPEIRAKVDALAALGSRDDLRYLLVTHETFAGSLDSYRGLVELQARRNLHNYEKLSESATKIDGRPGILFSYRGISAHAENIPIQFLVGLIKFEQEVILITAWCAEPLFNESQRTFENIILSYRKSPPPPSPETGSKPPS